MPLKQPPPHAEPPPPDEPSRHPAPVLQKRRPEIVSLTSLMAARLLRLKPRYGPKPMGQRVPDGLEMPRWALSLAILLLMLLFLALLTLFFVPAGAQAAKRSATGVNFDKPTKDWYQGPVRYIITKQEVKAYKAFDNDVDRGNFIEWFWRRRDIDPSTPENEFRDRFESRVLEATRMFNETTTPGWKTDMGKIYVLVGPPDEISRDLVAKTHRGIVTWVYRRPPYEDLSPNTVVAFARDASGAFRLSTNPTIDSDVARGLKYSRVKRTADDRYLVEGRADPVLLAHGVSITQTEMQTMMIGARLQQLPPYEEELFRAFAATREFYGSIPLETRFDFYRSAEGLTYTTVTVGVPSSSVQYRRKGDTDQPDVAVFGKLVGKDQDGQTYALASDSNFVESLENSSAGSDDLLLFQATGSFKPGRYQLVLGIQDKVSKKISSVRRDVEIPALAAGAPRLALSSITLAGVMEPIDYAASGGKPFHLGRFRVVPRPDAGFLKRDTLNVYFQVYDPAVDPQTQAPRLDVTYTFRSRGADGTVTDLASYEVAATAAQVQGYAVPLERWPEGRYEIAVIVVDRVSGQTIAATAPFTIEE